MNLNNPRVRLFGNNSRVYIPTSNNSVPFASNWIARFDWTSPKWSDDGVTPSVNSGNVVRWDDASGNGNHMRLVDGKTPATLDTTTYGKSCVVFTDSPMSLGQPTALVSLLNTTEEWTVFAFIRRRSLGNQNILTKNQNDTNRVFFAFNSNGGVANAWQSKAGAGATTDLAGTTQPHSYGYSTYPGVAPAGLGRQTAFIAGAAVNSITPSTMQSPDTTNNIVFGGWDAAFKDFFELDADVLSWGILSRSILPHEMVRIHDWYHAQTGVPNPRLGVPNLVWNSNSLSCRPAVVTTSDGTIPEAIRTTLEMPLGTVHNLGVSGKRTDEITAEGATWTDPLLAYLGADTAYMLWEGSNDVSAADIRTECEDRISAGLAKANIVVGTCLPRGTMGFDTIRNAENATVLSEYTDYAGAVADVGNDPTIGPVAATSDTNLYQNDTVHLAPGGADIAVPDFVDVLEPLLTP